MVQRPAVPLADEALIEQREGFFKKLESRIQNLLGEEKKLKGIVSKLTTEIGAAYGHKEKEVNDRLAKADALAKEAQQVLAHHQDNLKAHNKNVEEFNQQMEADLKSLESQKESVKNLEEQCAKTRKELEEAAGVLRKREGQCQILLDEAKAIKKAGEDAADARDGVLD